MGTRRLLVCSQLYTFPPWMLLLLMLLLLLLMLSLPLL